MRKNLIHQLFLTVVLPSTFVLSVQQEHSVVGQQRSINASKGNSRHEQRSTPRSPSQLPRQTALQELSSVIAEAQDLQNKSEAFKVLAKSGLYE